MNAPQRWTIKEVLDWTRGFFTDKGIDSPRLDAELLLAHALGVERIQLYTHFDKPLSDEERAVFREFVKRRGAREPVAYITGLRGFWGHDFHVSAATLVPRPETEHLIEAALHWVKTEDLSDRDLSILDLGTGSGCIGLSLAVELPKAMVTLTDLSPDALEVARLNGERLQVSDRIMAQAGSIWDAVPGQSQFDLVVTNPPYVESEAGPSLAPELSFEPQGALFAGPDGLQVIRELIAGLPARVRPGGMFLCEHGFEQGAAVAALLNPQDWSSVETRSDLAGHPRFVRAVRAAGG